MKKREQFQEVPIWSTTLKQYVGSVTIGRSFSPNVGSIQRHTVSANNKNM